MDKKDNVAGQRRSWSTCWSIRSARAATACSMSAPLPTSYSCNHARASPRNWRVAQGEWRGNLRDTPVAPDFGGRCLLYEQRLERLPIAEIMPGRELILTAPKPTSNTTVTLLAPKATLKWREVCGKLHIELPALFSQGEIPA